FIYHTHWHDEAQIRNGLYGPLIVLEPGQKLDSDLDRTYVFSVGIYPPLGFAMLINGRSEEHTSELQSGSISYAVFCLKKKELDVHPADRPHDVERGVAEDRRPAGLGHGVRSGAVERGQPAGADPWRRRAHGGRVSARAV